MRAGWGVRNMRGREGIPMGNGANRDVPSTSARAPCPTPILEWQRRLAAPPSPRALLFLDFYQAIQSPLPPLRDRHAWIGAHDVKVTLQMVLCHRWEKKKEMRKKMLETISRGIQRCLDDAKERTSYHIDQDCFKYGVVLSEEEKAEKVARHPVVQDWMQVLTSRYLINRRLELWHSSLRRPTQESLEDMVQAIESMLKKKSLVPKHYYKFLLSLITRQMPTLEEPSKVWPFLDSGPSARQLQLHAIHQDEKQPTQSLTELLNARDSQALGAPQKSLQLFEATWRQLCTNFSPDADFYNLALVMETKLASWRAISRGCTDSWEPVRRLLAKIQEKGLLRTSHLNQAIWASLRFDPNVLNDDRIQWVPLQWPSVTAALELYEEMRLNAVQAERSIMDQHNEQRPAFPRPPLDNPLLGKVESLAKDLLPSHNTYEIIIRGLTWRGNLKGAVTILDQMIQSPTDSLQRLRQLRRGGGVDEKPALPLFPSYKPSIATFDSFFRGFCKHGVPSRLIHHDPGRPEGSKWELEHSGDRNSDWTAEALVALLEELLALDVRDSRDSILPSRRKRKSILAKDKRKAVAPRNNSQTGKNNERREDWQSDSVLEELWPVTRSTPPESNFAPTSHQLFTIVTALRRISGDDNADWVLSQWQRLEDKFGPHGPGYDKRDKEFHRVNAGGWKGWSIDKRMQRTLDFLEDLKGRQMQERAEDEALAAKDRKESVEKGSG